MKLSALLAGQTRRSALPNVEIKTITDDSRKVVAGSLFFALKGTQKNGEAFIREAIDRGASAVVTDHDASLDGTWPIIEVKDARHALAVAAARFYALQPEVMTAVTGTSGKTSVVSFLRQIWTRAGFSAASVGTIGVTTSSGTLYGSLTTPDAITLHEILSGLAKDGITHAAIEASSHGLDQARLDGVRLCAAGFTNLSRDHMDYHKTVDDYFKVKMRLFDSILQRDLPAIIFADGTYSQAAYDHIRRANRQALTVGHQGNFVRLMSVRAEPIRQILVLQCDNRDYEVVLPLIGEFQVHNALVAVGLAIVTGVPEDAAISALEHLKGAEGRLQLVGVKNGSSIFVDYAHKPEALTNVLKAVRPLTQNRLIVVFGCGGDRDKGKRPLMGAIAQKLSDVVIVTDDNPRTEPAATIRQQILTAAPDAIEIADRRQAIHAAVAMLEKGDTLLVAGKGHETGQVLGTVTFPFSDKKEIIAALGEQKYG